jgi:phosphotransferase system IIB component
MIVTGKTHRSCQTRVSLSLHDVIVVDKRLVEQQLVVTHTVLQLR